MKVESALKDVANLFLDTSPVIYYVQSVAEFFPVVNWIFNQSETGVLEMITSPVALGECLVLPLSSGNKVLEESFVNLLTNTEGITLLNINEVIGQRSADLRVRYRLKLPDALQIATAISANCDAFLTNDAQLKRVSELKILVISELTV